MAEEILKDIFVLQIPLPNNPLKYLNSYYIKGNERNLLVDTGFNTEACYDALTTQLREINATMENTDIFLTHLHSDHSGLVPAVASDSSKVFIGENDRVIIERMLTPEYWYMVHEKFLRNGFTESELTKNRDNNPALKYMPSKQIEYSGVEEGFEFALGGHIFTAIFTPGHTPGHMCLYDKRRKILLSGDHILFDISPNIILWSEEGNSLGDYLSSLEKIRTLEIEHTLAAHRRPTGDCHGRINELIEHHAVRIAEAEKIVRNSPGISAYNAAAQMKWDIRAKSWADFPLAQKWFAVGEALAHLQYLYKTGAVKRDFVDGVFVFS